MAGLPATKHSSPAAERLTQREPCLPDALAVTSFSASSPCVLSQRLVQLDDAAVWLDSLAQSTPVHHQDDQVNKLAGCEVKNQASYIIPLHCPDTFTLAFVRLNYRM